MKLTRVQREVLKLMVKWEDHYAGIEKDYDTYAWILPGCDRWVRPQTIRSLLEKGLIMLGPVLPQMSNLPIWALTNPPTYITTIKGQQVGEDLLRKAGEEKVPVRFHDW